VLWQGRCCKRRGFHLPICQFAQDLPFSFRTSALAPSQLLGPLSFCPLDPHPHQVPPCVLLTTSLPVCSSHTPSLCAAVWRAPRPDDRGCAAFLPCTCLTTLAQRASPFNWRHGGTGMWAAPPPRPPSLYCALPRGKLTGIPGVPHHAPRYASTIGTVTFQGTV